MLFYFIDVRSTAADAMEKENGARRGGKVIELVEGSADVVSLFFHRRSQLSVSVCKGMTARGGKKTENNRRKPPCSGYSDN